MDTAGVGRQSESAPITVTLMRSEPDSPEHHQRRSEFIRGLVQASRAPRGTDGEAPGVPNTIVQFWHDPSRVPSDVMECISTWSKWETSGFSHRLFDSVAAEDFIKHSLGSDHARAFKRCYHPAMQADYFRLCYLVVEGGLYVDADDVCIASDISCLFVGSRLKIQPLCYDTDSDTMVSPTEFLLAGANDDGWIFYFNNNPLIAAQGDPVIDRALGRATQLLNSAADGVFPEIQSTTGPGNLSRTIFELRATPAIDDRVLVLHDWESIAISRWPLSYRHDARNWRLSNGKRFHATAQDM